MYKSQKIELKLNKSQKLLFNQYFGYFRYCYNRALDLWEKQYNDYKEGKEKYLTNYNIKDKSKSIKEEWEIDMPKMILETSVEDVSKAYNMWKKKVSRKPKFKSKKNQKNTCRFYRKNKYSLQVKNEKYLKLQGLNFTLKMKERLKIKGIIKEITISKKADKYFAGILLEVNKSKVKSLNNNNFCGIDLGISKFATIVDDNNKLIIFKGKIKKLNKLHKKINTLNKILSKKIEAKKEKIKKLNEKIKRLNKLRKNKGIKKRKKKLSYYDIPNSKRYEKAKTKLDRIYLKISNINNDYIHKITTKLVKKYKNICIENINTKKLLNKKINSLIKFLEEI